MYAVRITSLSEECYYHIKASLSCATNDVPQLLDSLNHLYGITHSFQDGFNKALCHRWLLNYDESLKECHILLNNNPSEDERVKIFWLISDLHLLKKEPDESYDWAKKAHDLMSKNPYDQSHPAFLGRSFRSGHHEGFATVLEYKHTHPVVVDWIQEVSISEAENPIESISQQIEKYFPDQKNHQEQGHQIASQYKQGIIPNSHEGAAVSLAKIILDDAFHVWRRGTYYREIAKNYGDSKALEKAAKILCYIRTVLAGIKEIFPNDAEKWQQYTELKRIVLREVKEKT